MKTIRGEQEDEEQEEKNMSAGRREAVRQFYNKWLNKGKEDEDDRSFWIDFLQNVLGIDNATDRIEFQKKVIGHDGNTKRIDAYIPETRVLIEQKSLKVDLSKPQQGHDKMTPYEQAKMYDNSLPVSEKARWIILSNFAEIWVYDMDQRKPEPVKFLLSELPNKYSEFNFLISQRQQAVRNEEMEVSVKAGEFVGLLYDAFHKEYINPDSEESLKSLNMLCVRLVFCLYAEDAHIFGDNSHMFHDYMAQYETKDMRKALLELFKVLDTKTEDRDPYDTSDAVRFPYVNGGLFAKEDIEIPNFTDEIRDILLNKASEGFDWSKISPTIFGAVFESTLNPETRRSGGMHYTSIENISKVIAPLFMDELNEEYSKVSELKVAKQKKQKLELFQDKLASLRWLDPACGSGNFLTETYIRVRRLENKVIRDILDCDRKQVDGQIVLGDVLNPIKVSIEQFYGIEINDFAVTVAKTALWIAESQTMKETEDIIAMSLDFLPLKTNANIHEGNALLADWNDIIPSSDLNYILGNPPFVGKSFQTSEQKKEMKEVLGNIKNSGNLDYVTCWYIKAAEYSRKTNIEFAFVSTNSICQGIAVPPLWNYLLNEEKMYIHFAYQTFKWQSEATGTATVHCVIVGLSHNNTKTPVLYTTNGDKRVVKNINAYLLDAPNIIISDRHEPISPVPKMAVGSFPTDGGNLVIKDDEYADITKKHPKIVPYIKPYIGPEELLKSKMRYCLWLKDASPADINGSQFIKERVASVRDYRLSSPKKQTQIRADTPTLFAEDRQPNCDYIMIPRTSSENRRYLPMGFFTKDTVAGDTIILPGATMYHFGILESNVHMAWMRTFCGRLEMRYRYSNTIVYNTFPWPTPTDEQIESIEQTAKGILSARALYPNSSLADLYNPLSMPIELQKAHTANDKAVMKAYGFDIKSTTEADCVAKLMQMYKELTETDR